MSDPVKAIANRIRHRCASLAETHLNHAESEGWQSLLFDGGRHRIDLRVSGARLDEALDALRAEVEVADFTIPGHLVADIQLANIRRNAGEALVRLEALTIRN